jgi:hypothetical protein
MDIFHISPSGHDTNFTSHQTHLSRFGHITAAPRFQVSSFADSQYADNKGFAEDLTEGKFSFPVVHGVRADTSNRQLLRESRVHVLPNPIPDSPIHLFPRLLMTIPTFS